MMHFLTVDFGHIQTLHLLLLDNLPSVTEKNTRAQQHLDGRPWSFATTENFYRTSGDISLSVDGSRPNLVQNSCPLC